MHAQPFDMIVEWSRDLVRTPPDSCLLLLLRETMYPVVCMRKQFLSLDEEGEEFGEEDSGVESGFGQDSHHPCLLLLLRETM